MAKFVDDPNPVYHKISLLERFREAVSKKVFFKL